MSRTTRHRRPWMVRDAFLPVLITVLATGLAPGPHPLAAQGALGAQTAQAAASATLQSPDPVADSLSREVDRLFERWHRPDSPGATVLVLRDGRVVHARGYGMASLEHGVPLRTNSVLDIASVSKQFGAFAIALLEADGALSVDDDVRTYLPELPDFGHTITLRHLIHHTSGLRDWPGTLSMAGWSYEDIMSFDQILRMAFHQRDLNFAPGEEYAYSNTGYNLLAEVVARVSGVSFRAFCEERIFGPLGMTRTHFHDDHSEVVRDRADSYRPAPASAGGGFRRVTSNLTALGSSSLFTTVEDLARWMLNFEEPVVGDAQVMARMHERGILNGGDTLVYAGGQNFGRTRGLENWSHGGSWAGYRSTLLRFPEQRFGVVILANTSDMNPGNLGQQIARLYLEEAMDPEPARTAAAGGGGGGGTGGGGAGGAADPWDPSSSELEGYAGEYHSHELLTSYRLEVRDGRLVAVHFRTGDRTFQPVAPDEFRSGGFGDVRFVRNADGTLLGFTANQTRIRGLLFERVRP
jgi:CubicO group peptidase (beta-lactamase class C family)